MSASDWVVLVLVSAATVLGIGMATGYVAFRFRVDNTRTGKTHEFRFGHKEDEKP